MSRRACCAKEGVKRGSWTAKEYSILVSYIKAHGEGKWREVPQRAGLRRCGKSCRLRWLNYLRPNIKRGNISDEEEELIIRLHNLLGNRWSLIAGRLPGRTDNEIKNYWNGTLRKKARPGAGGGTKTKAPDADGGAADADVVNSNDGVETASVWAPKAVRCTGDFFFCREMPPPAGELQTAGGGDGDDCRAGSPAPSSSSFPGAEPSFSGGDWMDDVRALESILESDEWLT